jgi:drug/metabolite transporter (DMT)-like permease
VLALAGVVIFIGADSGASGAALWVYALPVRASASMTFVTLWERRRAAIKLEIAANTSSPSELNMPIFTSLFWQGALTVLLLLPLAQQFENFAADWRIELFLGVIWLAVIASVGAYGLKSTSSVHARRHGFRHCNILCRR